MSTLDHYHHHHLPLPSRTTMTTLAPDAAAVYGADHLSERVSYQATSPTQLPHRPPSAVDVYNWLNVSPPKVYDATVEGLMYPPWSPASQPAFTQQPIYRPAPAPYTTALKDSIREEPFLSCYKPISPLSGMGSRFLHTSPSMPDSFMASQRASSSTPSTSAAPIPHQPTPELFSPLPTHHAAHHQDMSPIFRSGYASSTKSLSPATSNQRANDYAELRNPENPSTPVLKVSPPSPIVEKAPPAPQVLDLLNPSYIRPKPEPYTPPFSSPLSSVSSLPSETSPAPSVVGSRRPLKRFKASHIYLNVTPPCTLDTAGLKRLREFESDGHRYGTRSKLRSLCAEIEAHEKEEDLRAIRKRRVDFPQLQPQPRPQSRSATKERARPAPEDENPTQKEAPAKRLRPSPAIKEIKEQKPERSPSPRKGRPTRTSQRAAATNTAKVEAYRAASASRPAVSTPVITPAVTPIVTPAITPAATPEPAAVLSDLSDAPGSDVHSDENDEPESQITYPKRTFPLDVPFKDTFSLFYRRFPVSAYRDATSFGNRLPAGAVFNSPREPLDLYTPRLVKGVGRDKVGACPVCFEPAERGGCGKVVWLSMKFSAFNYHMQYFHGISPTSTRPFSPPVAYRTVDRQSKHKNEKSVMLEGQCHKCKSWVPMEGVKCVDAKLKEIYWWKHAASCHKGSSIEGETDVYVDDDHLKSIMATSSVA